MASIHQGALKFAPLNECFDDPELLAFWGVDSVATVEVPTIGKAERPIFSYREGGIKYELYRHPELFLSEDIFSWYQEYSYGCKTVPYYKSNPKYIYAVNIYERYIDKFRSEKV